MSISGLQWNRHGGEGVNGSWLAILTPLCQGGDREKGLDGALVLLAVSEDERALPHKQEGLSHVPPRR